jgi:hypothetical protein
MSNRDNMNWDEYNWNFDKDKAPKDTSDGSSNNNPWSTPSITCIGSACCYDGSTYDDVKNICVPNAVYEQQQEQVEEEPVEEKEEPVEEKEEPVEEEEEPVEEEEEPVESFTGFYSYISKHNIF